MQYFGAFLIKSELSLDELKEYYSNFADKEWECIVENQINTEVGLIEHANLAFKTEIEDVDTISHLSGT